MGLKGAEKRQAEAFRALKIVGLIILALIPIYHFVWHIPASLPPDIHSGMAVLLPDDADLTSVQSHVTPLGYVATFDSRMGDRSYRATWDRRSGEFGATTIVRRSVSAGHVISWLITVILVSYLVYRVCFGLLPRMFAARCPRCRQALSTDTEQLMGSRRIGHMVMPIVMKTTHTCSCGYQRSRVYIERAGGAGGEVVIAPARSGIIPAPAGKRVDGMTEEEWHQTYRRLKEEHEAEGSVD